MSDIPQLDRMIEESERVRQNQKWDRQERLAKIACGAVVIVLFALAPLVLLLGDFGVCLSLCLLAASLLPILVGHVFELVTWVLTPPRPRDPTKRYHYK